MIQACGRSTAMWSVIVLALAGPTPMFTIVMPLRSSRTRWYAGICGSRGGAAPRSSPGRAFAPAWRVITLPGSTNAEYADAPAAVSAIRSWPSRTNSSM